MTALRFSKIAPLGLAAALALGSLASAVAQTPNAPPPDRTEGRGDWREHRAEHRAQRVADMATVLKLSPSQAQALQAAMIPKGRDFNRRRQGEAAGETTPQRLDAEQARMAEREGRMREHLAAMRAFYGSLSPDQQKSFDALGRLIHGGMRGRHGMGGMGDRAERGGWIGSGYRGPPPPAQ